MGYTKKERPIVMPNDGFDMSEIPAPKCEHLANREDVCSMQTGDGINCNTGEIRSWAGL